MKRVNVLAVCVAASLVGGCGIVNYMTEFASEDYRVVKLPVRSSDAFLKEYAGDDKKFQIESLNKLNGCFADSSSSTGCLAIRNQYASLRLMQSNDICRDHVAHIFGNEAFYNVALGSGATLSAAAATAVPAAMAKTLWAGASTIFSGERTLMNEQVYKQVIAQKVGEAIRTKRDRLLAQIKSNLDSNDIVKYSLFSVDADISQYHEACSFQDGLVTVFNGDKNDKQPADYEKILARYDATFSEEITRLETDIAGLSKERDKADGVIIDNINKVSKISYEINDAKKELARLSALKKASNEEKIKIKRVKKFIEDSELARDALNDGVINLTDKKTSVINSISKLSDRLSVVKKVHEAGRAKNGA
ncbi:MAG: hypothetical protein H7840_04520 [Alphaproteobacteria bacterium]